MDISNRIENLKASLNGTDNTYKTTYLGSIHLEDGRVARLKLLLIVEDIE